MCILRARYRAIKCQQGVTVLELIIVVVIIGVLATLGIGGWSAQMEKEHAENAKAALQAVWQAEENYVAWKNTYTTDWAVLEIDNPNIVDKYYNYTIDSATSIDLLVTAKRIGQSKKFTIDEEGVLTEF